MGEAKWVKTKLAQSSDQAMEEIEQPVAVDTLGGRVQVRWDDGASATSMGQMAFFAEFLKVAGVFEAWAQDCPLNYTSPNAPTIHDVLGTWMMSALAGHKRYAHVAALRSDKASAEVLGIKRILSDDALRRALTAIAETEGNGVPWMRAHLKHSVLEALNVPWILDIDTTIKLLYGNQAGAEISYNPRKPGRPSHAVHAYWVGNLRLVLDVQVQPGKSHSANHTLPGLLDLLRELNAQQRPRLVRGDCAFGNAGVMSELEQIEQPYLFKLKQSPGVKRLIARQFRRDGWQDAGQGWQGLEDELKLMGWSHARRVVVLRHAVKAGLVLERKTGDAAQQELVFVDENQPIKAWEYAVLVTNAGHSVMALGQLYRDRADCENGFDELKNQWGLSGYSTQDIERCDLSAKAVALVYNWWSWYCRMAHPGARLEAVTSRPLLLAAVGRMTSHAGQTHLVLTAMHAAGKTIKAMITNIRKGLQHIREAAPQLQSAQRWQALLRYIVGKILTLVPPAILSLGLNQGG